MKSIWDISADLQAGRLKLLLQLHGETGGRPRWSG